MYRLARILVAGVGPADARFDKPSPDSPPFEVSCIGASDTPEDSVIWLENGGGKTVFLALLFHVLRPDKASQIGNDEKGRRAEIGDFVLSGDVSHVACEWVATDSDARLITGLVADRRGATVNRTWYLFAVRDGAASIDDLVFDVDGRRVTHARYLESLDQIASRAGKVGRQNRVVLTKATTQRQWFDILTDHDLDPALFEYQVRMNRSEGGATSLFRFPSAEKFVEFFLQLTLNPDTVATLTEELARVADKVSSLPRKELELSHASSAVERVGKLADTWASFEDLDRARADAKRRAESLHDRLAAAVTAATEALAGADEEVGATEHLLSEAQRERRENETRTRIVAIALGDARVQALEAVVAAAKDAAGKAALTADAWPRVPQLLRRISLAGEIRETRSALDAANADAAPLRERADSLLRGLRNALDTHKIVAERDYGEAEEARHTAEAAERGADGKRAGAAGAAKELDGRISEIVKQVEAHANARRNAVAAGLLLAGVRPADAHAGAQEELLAATGDLARLEGDRETLARELGPSRAKRDLAAGQLATTNAEHDRQLGAVNRASAARADLAAHALLAELGAEDVDLELVGADLAVRVSDEADRLRAAAVAAAAVTAEDRRAVDTLDRDRLLPARAEVDALCLQLVDGGISLAVPGWRYLVSAVPAAQHDAVIAAHPALLDGIVVPAAEIDRARAILDGAAPSAAIVVGVGAAFEDTSRSGSGWVVPPAAAMHDKAAAEVEIERRRELIDAADTTAALLRNAEVAARNLATALTSHLEEWPPGRLAAAVNTLTELEAALAIARTAVDDARASVETIEGWMRDLDGELSVARGRVSATERRLSRLEPLAAADLVAAEAEATLLGLRTERDEHQQVAADAAAALVEAREQRDAALAKRNTADQAISAANQQLAGLPDVDDGPAAEGDATELRSRYVTAVQIVTEATTDSELARRLTTLESERGQVESELTALSPAMQARLAALAVTPEAGDPVARRHADEEARRLSTVAAKAHADAASELSVARTKRTALAEPEPSWRVEPFDIPFELAALEVFLAELEAEGERTRAARSLVEEQLAALRSARTDAQQHHDALAAQLSGLTLAVGDRDALPASPFVGDAVAQVAAAVRAITETTERRERAELAWRAAATTLGRWARDAKWNELTGELARRLRDDDPEVLARDAAAVLTQTQILEARLREDIAGLDVHRQMLVTSLGDVVSEAARSLRNARRKSELPAGLGDWSHQPFLKIGCDIAKDRTDLDARLRRFTNDILERAPAAGLPVGADLVCRALLACAERDVTVEVLKPNKAQRLRYVPITEIATLSGGMRATAAIAMFCTLAKVRASNRSGRVGVGTLVLDNPLGDANATYLVALQRLMAATSDVQLVYTTGVNDMDALRMFPVVTRLTNEAAKRSHLAYVVADEVFLKRLAPTEADNAIITGTRLVRRTQPLLALDLANLDGDDE